MIKRLLEGLFSPPSTPEKTIEEKILSIEADGRMKLFVEDDTDTEIHALYSDHQGNLLVRIDSGERIESLGLVRLVQSISVPQCFTYSLPDWISSVEEYELTALQTVVRENLTTIESNYRSNLITDDKKNQNDISFALYGF